MEFKYLNIQLHSLIILNVFKDIYLKSSDKKYKNLDGMMVSKTKKDLRPSIKIDLLSRIFSITLNPIKLNTRNILDPTAPHRVSAAQETIILKMYY